MIRTAGSRSPSGAIICCEDGICFMPGASYHGTSGGYTNHYCRCRPCKDAYAIYRYPYVRMWRYSRRKETA